MQQVMPACVNNQPAGVFKARENYDLPASRQVQQQF